MNYLISSLEKIAHLVKNSSDEKKVESAIKSTRDLIKQLKQSISNGNTQALDQLEIELATWQTKLNVILKETVGRQGMTKHAQHWAERLKRI